MQNEILTVDCWGEEDSEIGFICSRLEDEEVESRIIGSDRVSLNNDNLFVLQAFNSSFLQTEDIESESVEANELATSTQQPDYFNTSVAASLCESQNSELAYFEDLKEASKYAGFVAQVYPMVQLLILKPDSENNLCQALDLSLAGHSGADNEDILKIIDCSITSPAFLCGKSTDTATIVVTAPAEIKFLQPFTESLNDENSDEYKDLANTTAYNLETSLKKLSVANLDKIVITGFTPGSVVCDYEVIFAMPAKSVSSDENQVSPSDLASSALNSLFDDIKSSGFGDFNVDESSLKIGEITEKLTCETGFFACSCTKTCLPGPFFCDGVVDCPDASDELHENCTLASTYQEEIDMASDLFVKSCGGNLLENEAQKVVLTHAQYPKHYSNEQNCVWYIKSPKDSLVTINFHEFNLEYRVISFN